MIIDKDPGEGGEIHLEKCDRCGHITNYKDMSDEEWVIYIEEENKIREHWDLIMRCNHYSHPQTRRYRIEGDLCLNCRREIVPYIHWLADVLELKYYVNKLKGAINERNKNNRSTS